MAYWTPMDNIMKNQENEYKCEGNLVASTRLNTARIAAREFLKQNKYFSGIFVKGDPTAICDASGVFYCSGIFGRGCTVHKLQPYRSAFQFMLFGSYERDHIVSQEVYHDAFREALNKSHGVGICYHNAVIIACTKYNAALVHRECHTKGNRPYKQEDLISFFEGKFGKYTISETGSLILV